MRTLRTLIIGGSAAALAIGVLPARAGEVMLDPQFGHHGVAEFTLAGGEAFPVSLAPGPGGTVVAGAAIESGASQSENWSVGRFTGDGSPDPTFGSGGFAQVPSGGDRLEQVAVAPDGSVLVLGDVGGTSAVLEHLSATGALDTTFAGGGVAGLPRAEGMAVQPDGKILVVGLTTVYRLMPDGTRDLGFGVNGAWNVDTPAGSASYLQAVAALPDGSILAGGDAGGRTGLWKLTSSGLPDLSYGTRGAAAIAIHDPKSDTTWSQALHLLPAADGSVLVTGGIGTSDAPYVARVTSAGALDPTFATNGLATFPADFGAATTTDGSAIYVAYTRQPDAVITVTKLTSAGAVDTKFGDAGSVSWLGDYRWTFLDGAVLRGGRLTLLGDATDSTFTENPMLLLRYVVDRPGHA